MGLVSRYLEWLHLGWPAGTVERMPAVNEDGTCAVSGVRIVGDLTGVPLLKFALETGAQAARAMADEISPPTSMSDVQNGGARAAPPDIDANAPRGRSTSDAKEKLDEAAPNHDHEPFDLVIVGAGVAGMAAAAEARARGLRFIVYESHEVLRTIREFPKAKPIFTYPSEFEPHARIKLSASVKESLLTEIEAQTNALREHVLMAKVERVERSGTTLLVHLAGGEVTRARRVIIAIGRSGDHRRLGVPGDDLDKVRHRMFDPADHAGQAVLVVGGGDSAIETAVASATAGARVTLSYRKPEFGRPKPENLRALGSLEEHEPLAPPPSGRSQGASASEGESAVRNTREVASAARARPGPGRIIRRMETKVRSIADGVVEIEDRFGHVEHITNDVVFAMIGREPPLEFFRRSNIPIRGEWRMRTLAGFVAFFAFTWFVYAWKASGWLNDWFRTHHLFPFNVRGMLGSALSDPSTLLGTIAISLEEPGFYYSLVYSALIVLFGADRMRRRRTSYIRAQTLTLMGIQILPLFLLPYVFLPWLGHSGVFDEGLPRYVADQLFPAVDYGQGREYWRAFGLVLAWPLFIWNFFTSEPMAWWLVIGLLQTFVVIPALVVRFGKGAYCGWICSCGALAETLGDRHRHKMPHGPLWNRVNLLGQVLLIVVAALFVLRVVSWAVPSSAFGQAVAVLYEEALSGFEVFGVPMNYYKVVDVFLAGIVGVGLYFWFSGRVWCRFACPLAALMHIYARFSRFAIFAEKKRCISCNLCTSVCHQGIDVMGFANKGLPMRDPQCVRCSACVEVCPTGVLAFGRKVGASERAGKLGSVGSVGAVGADGAGEDHVVFDRLSASPVRAREISSVSK